MNDTRALTAIAEWNKGQITLLEDSASMRDTCNVDELRGKISILNSLGDLLAEVTRPQLSVDDHDVIRAMMGAGGSFVRQLAALFQHTDPVNRGVIKKAWPEYWNKYENMAREAKASE